jgi:hypothetical protein
MQLSTFAEMHELAPALLAAVPIAPSAACACLEVLRAHADVLADPDVFSLVVSLVLQLADVARQPGSYAWLFFLKKLGMPIHRVCEDASEELIVGACEFAARLGKDNCEKIVDFVDQDERIGAMLSFLVQALTLSGSFDAASSALDVVQFWAALCYETLIPMESSRRPYYRRIFSPFLLALFPGWSGVFL